MLMHQVDAPSGTAASTSGALTWTVEASGALGGDIFLLLEDKFGDT